MKFAPKIFASILYFPSWRNHSDMRLAGKTFVSQQEKQHPSFLYEDRNVWGLGCMEELEEDNYNEGKAACQLTWFALLSTHAVPSLLIFLDTILALHHLSVK